VKRAVQKKYLSVASIIFFDGIKPPTVVRGYLVSTKEEVCSLLNRWYDLKVKETTDDMSEDWDAVARTDARNLDDVNPDDFADAEDIAELLKSYEEQQGGLLVDPVFAEMDREVSSFIEDYHRRR
jgi:hypothetical protein